MKKTLFFLLILFIFLWPKNIFGANPNPSPTPNYRIFNCPEELTNIYEARGEKCVTSYEEFIKAPSVNHLWVEDQEVTNQGKSNDRTRQFIYWVFSHSSIDNHHGLIKIWSMARNVSYFFLIISAALLGLAYIVGQRANFEMGIKIWSSIIRLLTSAVFIFFSATIVISLIQLSEVLIKFFIENLGGKDLFNVYFSGNNTEQGYIEFIGIKDLNYKVQESIKTQLFFLKITNLCYYLLGIVIILRKIILWFLLFVSPFLPLLFSFYLTKNIGWIWIGVFFQWLFYGPLLALFLGGLATIWKNGIPYSFDFSRGGTIEGYIYPTGTNILWGGPAQQLDILKNINYVDPYAEYIITLIMLLAVIFFPWWLLRTFRDYCCDGINAIKNILLSKLGPGKSLPPILPPVTNLDSLLKAKTQRQIETTVKTRLETTEEIKKAKTEEIVNSFNMKANSLADIAKFETKRENIINLNYLKNPAQAATMTDRQRYMSIRTELTGRAIKSDLVAQKVVSSLFVSSREQLKNKSQIISTLPKMANTQQIISYKIKLPTNKIQQITNSVTNLSATNTSLVQKVASKVNLDAQTVQRTINLFNQSTTTSPSTVVKTIGNQLKEENKILAEDKVKDILKEYLMLIKLTPEILEEVAKKENTEKKKVEEVVNHQEKLLTESEKNIEEAIIIPQTVSIDEYEQVKQMWISQYEKGEIPKTENIFDRYQWVDNDIVLITNVLNKLYSDNEELKKQGLDEVSYILPLFIMNNLNGEQLVTYLKAKLEAAKMVKILLDKEKEIKEKIKKESEKIEIRIPKEKKAVKEMHMEMELDKDKT